MKQIILLIIIICSSACSTKHAAKTPPKVLLFSKTAGYHHQSIPDGIKAIMKIAKDQKFSVDTSTNSSLFNPQDLSNYKAVIFLHTTGDILNDHQQKSFEQYIQSGGGFVGIHSATDTEYDWPWFNQLVGAYFSDHPAIQEAKILVADNKHISTIHLESIWQRTDEWYNFKSMANGINVLLNLDEKSYQGGKMGDLHPIAWYREFDGGKTWYTGLGHTSESFLEEAFIKHLSGGINYVMSK